MALQVTCSNASCSKVLNLQEEAAGKKVRCPDCGTVIAVPAVEGEGALTGESKQEAPVMRYHPARRACTNCGTVLSARAVICPGCGGDVRTGVTRMRITAEEKEKAGIFAGVSWTKRKGTKRSPAGRLAVVVVVLVVIAALVFGALRLTKSWSPSRSAAPVEEASPTETTGP
jgi:hypothetical protein